MGESRQVMDRITDALVSGDMEAVRATYAEDAVLETPDAGELRGREAIAGYFEEFTSAFSDLGWEQRRKHEHASVAIDEGWFTGTHTGPLPAGDGQTIEATGRRLRVRECDVLEARDGLAVSHRMYYDQVEFLDQLGLMEQPAGSQVAG